MDCNTLIPGVRITVSVRDTAYKIGMTSVVVRLSQFQFQKLFPNIVDFSRFFGNFLDYFGEFPLSVSTDTDNQPSDFYFTNGVEF